MTFVKPKNDLSPPANTLKKAVISLVLAVLMVPSAVLAAKAPNCAYLSQNAVVSVPTSGITTASVNEYDDEIDVFCPDLPAINAPDKVVRRATITVYSSTPDQTDDSPFIAASGKRVHDGMIAANGLPFGTKIKIPELYGDKVFVVEDRMNKRYGFGHFDIWMDAPKSVLYKFGVKRLDVEIYYPDKEVAVK